MGWEVGGRIKKEIHIYTYDADVRQKPIQYCNYPSLKNRYILINKYYLMTTNYCKKNLFENLFMKDLNQQY